MIKIASFRLPISLLTVFVLLQPFSGHAGLSVTNSNFGTRIPARGAIKKIAERDSLFFPGQNKLQKLQTPPDDAWASSGVFGSVAKIGPWSQNPQYYARFGHSNFDGATNFGFMQVNNGTGDCYIGAGITNVTNTLLVGGYATFGSGNAKIGTWSQNANYVRFGHAGFDGATNFGFMQINNTTGDCYIGAGLTNITNDLHVGGASYVMGNMGIGTASPTEKLSVNGTILAKKVRVQTGWSDYVFDTDYRLLSLQDLAAYINKHKHLPEIPSALEVEENGLDVGASQALLLKKIEELTLHMIRQDKQINYLLEENSKLKKSKKTVGK
jgi:hypothetical protein